MQTERKGQTQNLDFSSIRKIPVTLRHIFSLCCMRNDKDFLLHSIRFNFSEPIYEIFISTFIFLRIFLSFKFRI